MRITFLSLNASGIRSMSLMSSDELEREIGSASRSLVLEVEPTIAVEKCNVDH